MLDSGSKYTLAGSNNGPGQVRQHSAGAHVKPAPGFRSRTEEPRAFGGAPSESQRALRLLQRLGRWHCHGPQREVPGRLSTGHPSGVFSWVKDSCLEMLLQNEVCRRATNTVVGPGQIAQCESIVLIGQGWGFISTQGSYKQQPMNA